KTSENHEKTNSRSACSSLDIEKWLKKRPKNPVKTPILQTTTSGLVAANGYETPSICEFLHPLLDME
ncbi:hypothetical protein ACSZOM_23225, partial [Aeromonas hydrophila]